MNDEQIERLIAVLERIAVVMEVTAQADASMVGDWRKLNKIDANLSHWPIAPVAPKDTEDDVPEL